MPWWARSLTLVYAAMPSACILLLSFGDLRARFPFFALGIIGFVGLAAIVWLSREIQRNAAALRVALAPDPSRSDEIERELLRRRGDHLFSVGGAEGR